MTVDAGEQRAGPLAAVAPEALFLISAIGQYAGASIAVRMFDELDASTVALLRVAAASISLIVLTRAWRHPWTRLELRTVALFGVLTAVMNLLFYLAIERLPLGKGVTIEFIGPITVAAWRTRSTRNTVALASAVIGVAVLSGASVHGSAAGLAFIFAASACWAGYILVGYRVAGSNRGVASLGVGLAFGTVAIAPFGIAGLSKAVRSPTLLARGALVGLLSNTVGYGIDQVVMRRLSTRRFAVMLALLPVVALIAGAVALGQHPHAVDLIGVAFVVVGVAAQDRS